MMKNAERLKAHKDRLRGAGFELITAWVCPELAKLLRVSRRPGECRGRTLERLILGQARPRPEYWSDAELKAKDERPRRGRTRRRIAGLMERVEAATADASVRAKVNAGAGVSLETE